MIMEKQGDRNEFQVVLVSVFIHVNFSLIVLLRANLNLTMLEMFAYH